MTDCVIRVFLKLPVDPGWPLISNLPSSLSSSTSAQPVWKGIILFGIGARIFVIRRNIFVMNLLDLSDREWSPLFLGVALTCWYYCRANEGKCYIMYHQYDDRGGDYLSNRQYWWVRREKDIAFIISTLLGRQGVPTYCWCYCHANSGSLIVAVAYSSSIPFSNSRGQKVKWHVTGINERCVVCKLRMVTLSLSVNLPAVL